MITRSSNVVLQSPMTIITMLHTMYVMFKIHILIDMVNDNLFCCQCHHRLFMMFTCKIDLPQGSNVEMLNYCEDIVDFCSYTIML